MEVPSGPSLQTVEFAVFLGYLPWATSPSSSGLGHRPLTPETGVRVPLGTPVSLAFAYGRSRNGTKLRWAGPV